MNDTISRRAAIDEIGEWIKAFLEQGYRESAADACLIQDGIIQLPPAQPAMTAEEWKLVKQLRSYHNGSYAQVLDKLIAAAQPEIVTCKDCKWKQGAECVMFAEVRPFPDDFCSRAERRTDD